MSQSTTFDLFIAGGGINGAALARIAAARGMAVGLCEAGDFARGASSNTSKLIHGGLRYLETRDFGLVRDAVRERARLLALAPHLVRPARFLFPLGSFARHGRWAAKAGMALYDFLAGDAGLPAHGYVPEAEFRRLEPAFLPGEKVSAYAYSDCVMDDARLNLETLLDAEAQGAEVFNYHRVSGLEPFSEGWEITAENRLTGRERVFRSRRVALALGPWTDAVLRETLGESKPRVRLSRGSHLLLEGLPSQSCFILPVPGTRRYFFVLPFHGVHLAGTTEVEMTDPGGEIRADPAEKEELLRLVRHYFPRAETRVLAAFAGIRPLARGGGSTVTLSREHVFHKLRDGLYAAVGGKYTTHRVLARDYLAFILGEKKRGIPLVDRPYPGAFGPGGEESARRELEKLDAGPRAAWPRWLSTYGARALELAKFVAVEPGRQRFLPGGGLCAGEVLFSARREHCRNAVDFFRRRTGLYFTSGAGLEALAEVERILAEANGGAPPGEESDYRGFLRRQGHAAAGGAP